MKLYNIDNNNTNIGLYIPRHSAFCVFATKRQKGEENKLKKEKKGKSSYKDKIITYDVGLKIHREGILLQDGIIQEIVKPNSVDSPRGYHSNELLGLEEEREYIAPPYNEGSLNSSYKDNIKYLNLDYPNIITIYIVLPNEKFLEDAHEHFNGERLLYSDILGALSKTCWGYEYREKIGTGVRLQCITFQMFAEKAVNNTISSDSKDE